MGERERGMNALNRMVRGEEEEREREREREERVRERGREREREGGRRENERDIHCCGEMERLHN